MSKLREEQSRRRQGSEKRQEGYRHEELFT